MYCKNYLITLLLLFSYGKSFSQVKNVRFLYVDPGSGAFAIKNFLGADSSLGMWRAASNGVDTPLSKLTMVIGTISPCKNKEFAVLKGLPMNKIKGSLTLYLPNMPLDTASLHDFLQWGDSDQVNEAEAVSKGLWRKGRYVKDNPPFNFKGSSKDYDDTNWVGIKPPIIILRFAYVNPSTNTICIKNAGVSNIDLGFSALSIGNTSYDSIKNIPMNIIKGSLNVLKGDSFVFQLTSDSLKTSNSLALFAFPKLYSDTSMLLDFVQWGDSLQPFSGLAHFKGIWDSTTTVHLTTGKDSIVYIGDFTQLQTGASWWQSRTPAYVPGIGISDLSYPPSHLQIFPNPTHEGFYVNTTKPINAVQIVDLQGRVVSSQALSANSNYVSTAGLASGIYLCRLAVDGQWSLPEKLIVQE